QALDTPFAPGAGAPTKNNRGRNCRSTAPVRTPGTAGTPDRSMRTAGYAGPPDRSVQNAVGPDITLPFAPGAGAPTKTIRHQGRNCRSTAPVRTPGTAGTPDRPVRTAGNTESPAPHSSVVDQH